MLTMAEAQSYAKMKTTVNITASLKSNIKKVFYLIFLIQNINFKTFKLWFSFEVHRTADFSIPEISNKTPKADFKVLPEDLIKNSMELNLK